MALAVASGCAVAIDQVASWRAGSAKQGERAPGWPASATPGGQAMPAGRWEDCVVLGHALLAGRPLADLPGMVAIAERSIFAAHAGTW
jgi:hypothetical protein